jgi:hypothetical protein
MNGARWVLVLRATGARWEIHTPAMDPPPLKAGKKYWAITDPDTLLTDLLGEQWIVRSGHQVSYSNDPRQPEVVA